MKLAVLLSFSGAGGVEKMVMNLVREFAQVDQQSLCVELILIRAQGPHLKDIPANVTVIKLTAKHTLTAIPELIRYLKTSKPDAMLVAKDRAGRAAVTARAIARLTSAITTRIYVRLGTNLSTALEHKSALNAWWRKAPMRLIYPHVDKIIAVSEGVKTDTLNITGVEKDRVCVIRNPVITAQFIDQLNATLTNNQAAPHPWLQQKTCPVIMGVGRLSVQKDFGTLLTAFHQLLASTNAKLIIVGEGGKRLQLEAQIKQLGLQEHVLLPGFKADLYAWLKHADVFVLSSKWEGSPNVLTEALALGVPCVATRCPSGPDEVLQEGKYGPLVPVGDAQAMAQAIHTVLAAPHPPVFLKQAVEEYRADISAKKYLAVLRGEG